MTAQKQSRRRWSAESEAELVLEKRTVRATDLVAAIRTVNPTGLGLSDSLERKRYVLKSRLQSRLILEFFTDLDLDEVLGETGVVGLRYRPEGRDACHAVLAELNDDARSKVQFHLDTRGEEALQRGADAHSARLPAGATDLVGQGQQALGEFEYEKARRCFEGALLDSDDDDDSAAVALLEFFVDHLAAWRDALEVEARLSTKQLTPPVRTLLALAAALSGDGETCCRLAMDISSPRLAVAFSALANQALLKSDCTDATRLLAVARQFDATAPEAAAVEVELARVKAAEREPAERELETLRSSASEEAVAHAERHTEELVEELNHADGHPLCLTELLVDFGGEILGGLGEAVFLTRLEADLHAQECSKKARAGTAAMLGQSVKVEDDCRPESRAAERCPAAGQTAGPTTPRALPVRGEAKRYRN